MTYETPHSPPLEPGSPSVPLPPKASGRPGHRGLRGRLLLHVNGYTTKWGRRWCSTETPGVLQLWREHKAGAADEPCALDLSEAVVTLHRAQSNQFFVASRTWGIVRLKAPAAYVGDWIKSIEDSITRLRMAQLCFYVHSDGDLKTNPGETPVVGIPLWESEHGADVEAKAEAGVAQDTLRNTLSPLETLLATLHQAAAHLGEGGREKDKKVLKNKSNGESERLVFHPEGFVSEGGDGHSVPSTATVTLRRETWDAILDAAARFQSVLRGPPAIRMASSTNYTQWLSMSEAEHIICDHAECLAVSSSPLRVSVPVGARHLRGTSLWDVSSTRGGPGTASFAKMHDALTVGAENHFQDCSSSDTHSESDVNPPAYDVSECISDAERHTLPMMPTFKSGKSLWGILKRKILNPRVTLSLPVCFNSPQSSLQRASEEMEHAHLLSIAAQMPRSLDRIAYVAVWCCTHYSSVRHRPHKPFNPLLGETFELQGSLGDGTGYDSLPGSSGGFRYFTEKVAHNPSCGAYAINDTHGLWNGWGDFTLTTTLGATCAVVGFDGTGRLDFPATGDTYTYTKGNCTVTGILSGDIKVDVAAEFSIVNHSTGERAQVCIKGSTVSGSVGTMPPSESGKMKKGSMFPVAYLLEGTVDGHIDVIPIAPELIAACPRHAATPLLPGHTRTDIPTHERHCVWVGKGTADPGSTPFGMSRFAADLNRLTHDMLSTLPRTDSRWRPDIRMLEFSDVGEADRWKDALEAAQRLRREAKAVVPPGWFKRSTCALTGRECWEPTGEYWPAREKGQAPSSGVDLMLLATPSAWPENADPRLLLLPLVSSN